MVAAAAAGQGQQQEGQKTETVEFFHCAFPGSLCIIAPNRINGPIDKQIRPIALAEILS
jgi:hypothetical protein